AVGYNAADRRAASGRAAGGIARDVAAHVRRVEADVPRDAGEAAERDRRDASGDACGGEETAVRGAASTTRCGGSAKAGRGRVYESLSSKVAWSGGAHKTRAGRRVHAHVPGARPAWSGGAADGAP